MEYRFHPLSLEDKTPAMEILNYYGENTFAAYFEGRLPEEVFDSLYQMTRHYPALSVKDENGKLLGFGMMRAYHYFPTFAHTAELSYFLHPEATGQGIGGRLLETLCEMAKQQGITTLVASIASLNPGSINFHLQHGFTECGRFKRMFRKKGKDIDLVWMQRFLD